MAKKDYKAMAAGIIKQAGGADNIVSATHCMTRLRLVLRDRSKFDTDAVKQVPGVLNVIIQNGEYQVVIGQDVPDLYEEVVKIDGIQAGGSVQDDEAAAKDLAQDHGNIGNAILSFIGGTFSPVIPVLVAGGLTGAVLSLLTNVFGVSAESGTYTIFYAINQATFYFLPIFIGFAAAARLKSNGFLGAFLGAILLYSSINGAEGLDFFGIPVQAISYNSTVFPVILGVLFMSVVYKFLQKHIPVFLKTIVVPLLTMRLFSEERKQKTADHGACHPDRSRPHRQHRGHLAGKRCLRSVPGSSRAGRHGHRHHHPADGFLWYEQRHLPCGLCPDGSCQL